MRFSKATLLAGSLALLVAGSTVLSAESINPPTTPQTAPMTAKESALFGFIDLLRGMRIYM